MRNMILYGALAGMVFVGITGYERIRTEWNMASEKVRETIQNMEPTARMLERIRSDLKHADKDLEKLYSIGAECQWNISRIEEDIATGTKNIAGRERKLKLLMDALEKNPQSALFRFGGKDYSRTDVIADVANKTRELGLLNTIMERKRFALSYWRTNLQAVEEQISLFTGRKEKGYGDLMDFEFRDSLGTLDGSGVKSGSSYLDSAEKILAAARERIEGNERINSFKKGEAGIDPVDAQPGDPSLHQEEDVIRHARESMKLSNPPAPPPVIAPQNTPAAGVIERRNSGVKYVALDKNNPPLISFVN